MDPLVNLKCDKAAFFTLYIHSTLRIIHIAVSATEHALCTEVCTHLSFIDQILPRIALRLHFLVLKPVAR